jgi:hypothetical protein
MSEPIRLNLGAGGTVIPGFTPVDRKLGGEVFPLAAYADGSVAEIYASHVLEHFSFRDVEEVLREWVRVLEPGGTLRLAVPNFAWIARTYLDAPESQDVPIQGYVMGGHVDEDDVHGCIFDKDGLAELMAALGLTNIREWEPWVDDCSKLPVSLNLMGVKGAAPTVPWEEEEKAHYSVGALQSEYREQLLSERGREIMAGVPDEPELAAHTPEPETIHMPAGAVKAVIAMPRLAFTDNLFCAHRALIPLGIPLEKLTGVFWHQAMAELLEAHLTDGTKYALTLDYDTLFEQRDVLELCRVMETRPEIDALCALQMRREEDSPLFCIGKFQGTAPRTVEVPAEELRAEAMPLTTGHFGLTLFRMDSLRRLPRPWFMARPNAEGRWGEGRADADISFWHDWKEHGLSLYVANRVPVGHLELMVKWPDRRMRAMHQNLSEYNLRGKPVEVWR